MDWSFVKRITQLLSKIGAEVSSKVQQIARRKPLCQSKMLAMHKLPVDQSHTNVFEPLTPVVMSDEQSGRYLNELRHALMNDQVRNIAITGDYGAGKSSLIRTFVAKHPELTYAWISLATFGKDGVVDSPISSLQSEGDGRADVSSSQSEAKAEAKLVERIEETIVQQLLYSVKAKDLPKTRLKRIVQASKSSILWTSIFLSAVLIGGTRLYAENLTTIWAIEPSWLVDLLLCIPDWLAASLVGIGAFLLIYRFTSLFSAFNIDGLTVKGGKLEATNHGSVLHKNVDELIYCFERSNIDVVLIEDLDRFGIQDVFFRLREINLIIKNSPQINRPIFFVYALRDELFVSSEKTKFFDVIIPVIPVVNFENSQQKLIELLSVRKIKNETLFDGLDPVLVETISYYIDDMRLLKNIVNEFDMYASLLASEMNLDRNKLLAIIFIRNLYPKEYAGLLRRAGVIYDLFKIFDLWKLEQISDIEAKADTERLEINLRKELVAKNVIELREQLWFELLRLAGADYASHFQVDTGHVYSMSQFLNDEIFAELEKDDVTIAVGKPDYGFQQIGKRVKFSAVLNMSSPSYSKKVSLLSTSAGTLASTLNKLGEEKDRVQRLPLKGALDYRTFNEKVVSHFSSMKAMSYLVRAGFFSTDYAAYVGYFYAGALGMEDMNLILDLRAGRLPAVGSSLVNPKLVLSKLSHADLEGGRGLLSGFIEYLCGPLQSDSIGKQKHSALESILEGSFDHLDRISEVITTLLDSDSLLGFMRAIYHYQVGLYQAILKTSEQFSGILSRQKLFMGILSSLNIDEIDDVESDPEASFVPLLEALDDVSLLIPTLLDLTGGWKYFTTHPVEFHSLGIGQSAESIKHLIGLGFLKLNLPMLALVEATLAPDRPAGSGISYYSLSQLSIPGLERLIMRNSSSFVQVLLTQEGMLAETSASLTWLFNSIDKHQDLMFELLERTDAIFEMIESVPEVLWPNILSSDSILPSKDTIYICFDYFYYTEDGEFVAADPASDETTNIEQTSAFLGFVTRHADALKSVLWTDKGNATNDLQKTLLSDSRVSDASIRMLLSETVLEDFSVLSEIKPSRWAMLVILDYLPYDQAVLACITEKAPLCIATYLTERWTEAAKDFDPLTASMDVLIGVTKSAAVTIMEKVDLWKGISGDLFKEHAGARAEIARICEVGNRTNVTFPSSTCVHMLWFVSTDTSIPSRQRIEAFLQVVATKGVEWSHAAQFLENLDEDGFKRLAKKDRRFTVLNSDVNLRLINALRAKGFVGKATEKKEKIVVSVMTSALK
ncbi:hypothetical protein [Pseudomonas sp. GL-RE-26]|uniref:YobI family P-loop NTPase n=1 Tax=Pseudomonas sp. GL-RE-26 TaxID=2832390 RepID=UPI001CC05A08|nr:hypothetical protein [Pseudomonas sp. GL-RE-26]